MREESDHRWRTRCTRQTARRAGQPDLPEVERGCWTTGPPTRPSRPASSSAHAGANGANEYVFYDGPPFANGLPHYGHLLTGYVKDVVPRYQTMRGRRVERRFGWDCHGLPAEVEAEKQLGISTKAEILELGVDKFNDACRTSVLRYTQDWERYVTRQARWVDFANDYKTLDLDYMESVMWAFKTLHDKGLIYEGFRVLAYCWRCETPLSNTETRMDDVYRDRQDPALDGLVRAGSDERAGQALRGPRGSLVVDHHAVDAAVQRRAGGRARHRLRRCWSRTGTGTSLAEARLSAYQKEFGDAVPVGDGEGPRPGRAALHADLRLPGRAGRRAGRLHGAGRRLRHHRGRHRRRARGARPR